MSWDASTEIEMSGYEGHFWPAVSSDAETLIDGASQIMQCTPRELTSCSACSCSGGDLMCFSCAASQGRSKSYKAHGAKNSGTDDCTDDADCDGGEDDDDAIHYQDEDDDDKDTAKEEKAANDVEVLALARASQSLAESECFICEGFSANTCTLALTTVIAGLSDASRLAIEKELLDDGSTQEEGGSGAAAQSSSVCEGTSSDAECLETLDASFQALRTSEKLDLMLNMCALVEDKAGLGEQGASASAKGALGIHETKAEAKAAVRAAKAEAALTSEGQAKAAVKTAAKEAKKVALKAEKEEEEAAAAAKEVAAAAASSKSSKSGSSSCSMCQGFSAKTCALALTNVITGLDDGTRLDIHTALLPAPALCSGVPGASVACLAKLDKAFDALAVGAKMQLVGDMCELLETAEKEMTTSSAEQAAAAHLASTDDEVTSAAAHAVNTRNALLSHSSSSSSSSAEEEKEEKDSAAATTTKTSVQIEALLDSVDLQQVGEPQCLLCEGLGDRVCLAALDASFQGLTDRQRLTVSLRVLTGYPTFTACGEEDGDLSCLAKLDASFSTLSDEDRLNVLKDACTLGSYGTSAAALAATSAAASGPVNQAQTTEALLSAASGSGSSGFAPGPSCASQFCVVAKLAASLAADALALKGGVAFLVTGSTSPAEWKSTLGHLATVALPTVTATMDTAATTSSGLSNLLSLGGPSAGGVSLAGLTSATHAAAGSAATSLSAVSSTTYRALKTSLLAADPSASSTSFATTTASSSSSSSESDTGGIGGIATFLSFSGGALAAMAFASTLFAVKRNFGASSPSSSASQGRSSAHEGHPRASPTEQYTAIPEPPEPLATQPAFVIPSL